MTSVVQQYEATRILFVCKENKNNYFNQQFFSATQYLPPLLRALRGLDIGIHERNVLTALHCCIMMIRKLSDFIKNILICVLKMNEGLTGLEQHEGE